VVARVLIEHLLTRTETRWRCYEENGDFPEKDDENWLKYVNSVYEEGKVKVILRDLVGKDEIYEH
jgi:adenylylsulfate reductase subunit A